MFKTYLVEDNLMLKVPEYFGDKDTIIFQKLSNKFIDKVIYGIGLSIALEDNFIKSESKIIPVEGCAHFKLRFKLLVFSPSVDDVFKANVLSINKNYIQYHNNYPVTTGFFSDILAMAHLMSPNCEYDKNIRSWVRVEGDQRRTIKENEEVLFKVLDVIYNPDREDRPRDAEGNPLPVLMVIGTIL